MSSSEAMNSPETLGSPNALDAPPAEPAAHTHNSISAASSYSSNNEGNDTAQIANGKNQDELDTCRICRGEGTADEPLFYPCKCSGSIKFVHQECLMEWLSHSQKKHCELCKTPFRFTKLYDPHMPAGLPTPVFLRRAAVHLLKALLGWLRGLLVVSVWTLWLPWSMRYAWWIQFWIGDGEWADIFQDLRHEVQAPSNPGPHAANNLTLVQGLWDVFANMPTFTGMLPFGQANATIEEHHQNASQTDILTQGMSLPGTDSLLSNVTFLRTLTPNTGFNMFVIATIEGQVITLSVVTVFVLVFLIREWVVQQQPALNLGAINDDPDNANAINAGDDQEMAADEGSESEQEQPLVSREEELEPLDIGPETIAELILELERNQPALTYLGRSDFAQWHGDRYELRRGRDAVVTTRRAYFTIKKAAQDALETGDEAAARLALDRLQRLQDALRLLPWRDELDTESIVASLQAYISTARELLDVQGAPSVAPAAAPAGLFGGDSGPGSSEAAGFSEALDAREARPEMPARSMSSIAADIRRGLEESHESLGPSASRPDTTWNFDKVVDAAEEDAAGAGPTEPNADDILNHDVFTQTNSDWQQPSSTPATQPVAEAPRAAEPVQTVGDVRVPEAGPPEHPPPHGLYERLMDWMYGDLVPPVAGEQSEPEQNDEHVVQDLEAEAPFVPMNEGRHEPNAPEEEEDVEDAAAVAAQEAINANDAEAEADAEDLEGVLELIGLQGPLIGLFQNAVFAAVLVSATITSAILFPYLCGKLVLLVAAHPVGAVTLPVRFVTGLTNFAIDFVIVAGSSIMWTVLWMWDSMLRPLFMVLPVTVVRVIRPMKLAVLFRAQADAASIRVIRNFIIAERGADQMTMSMSALMSLRSLQMQFGENFVAFKTAAVEIQGASINVRALTITQATAFFTSAAKWIGHYLASELEASLNVVKSLFYSGGSSPAAPALESLSLVWTISDRITAICAGYAFFAIAGAVYIGRGTPLSTSEQGRKIELVVLELFQQSAGVVKVITIIGIEMLMFPLYCGFLLDVAMLPLFQDSTFASRIAFTVRSPWTSAFFHWFVGTCYMFHFALFVSMCRRIFRKGVLYFIRDPDDPNFHPVRDVLERSVSSQLRKIGFSALVYGALVILCMGSVIWGLAYGADVFPIKWTSKNSAIGYPLDLLLYNQIAPIAMHIFRPSKGIHKVYEWWYRLSARGLRLSHFLFKEEDHNHTGGSYVRAPASDSVRIPRGRSVFLPVDADNNRLDGKDDPHGIDHAHGRNNADFIKIWIPSHFALRIAAFVFTIWLLTATLGVAVTVLPLVLGRKAISMTSLAGQPVNDIFAYFAGAGPFAALYMCRTPAAKAWKMVKAVRVSPETFQLLSLRLSASVARGLSLFYVYGALAIVAPTTLALLLECYFILPLQTYLSSTQHAPSYTVHLVQDWTLGVMYLRIIINLLLLDADSRPARGLRAIVAKGWLEPNVRIATRCFLVPLGLIASVAFGLPLLLSWVVWQAAPLLAERTILPQVVADWAGGRSHDFQVNTMRFSFPVVLVHGLAIWLLVLLRRAASQWRLSIRDEIYLIGERLHNFGDRKAGAGGLSLNGRGVTV